jgi:hypothetical protein
MSILLTVAGIYLPQFIRKRNLEMLFAATADAFRVIPPSTRGLTYDKALKLYARFTQIQAEKSLEKGDVREVQSCLFDNAHRIGQLTKENFNVNTVEEAIRTGAVIYKMLKIDFHGKSPRDIVIRRCFFSDYYSSKVCQLVSSLDIGLFAGLSGGGKLSFAQRITEGNECCRAYLEMPGGK